MLQWATPRGQPWSKQWTREESAHAKDKKPTDGQSPSVAGQSSHGRNRNGVKHTHAQHPDCVHDKKANSIGCETNQTNPAGRKHDSKARKESGLKAIAKPGKNGLG